MLASPAETLRTWDVRVQLGVVVDNLETLDFLVQFQTICFIVGIHAASLRQNRLQAVGPEASTPSRCNFIGLTWTLRNLPFSWFAYIYIYILRKVGFLGPFRVWG